MKGRSEKRKAGSGKRIDQIMVHSPAKERGEFHHRDTEDAEGNAVEKENRLCKERGNDFSL